MKTTIMLCFIVSLFCLLISSSPICAQNMEVPYYYQFNSNWCWANSLSMILRYYGYDRKPWVIASDFNKGYSEGLNDFDMPNVHAYLENNFCGSYSDAWNWDSNFFGNTETYFKNKVYSVISSGHPIWTAFIKANGNKHVIVISGCTGTNTLDKITFNDPAANLLPNDDSIGVTCTWDQFFQNTRISLMTPFHLIYANPNKLSPFKPIKPVSIWVQPFCFLFRMPDTGEELTFTWDGVEPYDGYNYYPDTAGIWPPDNDEDDYQYDYKATQSSVLLLVPLCANYSFTSNANIRFRYTIRSATDFFVTTVRQWTTPLSLEVPPKTVINGVPDEFDYELPLNILSEGVYKISIEVIDDTGAYIDGCSFKFGVVGTDLVHFIIIPQAGNNGAISPSSPTDVTGEDFVSFTATPSSGYEVDSWIAYYHSSGYTSTVQTGGNTCTLPSVNQDITLSVYFKKSDDGPGPFGDLVITEPAASPYQTGKDSVTFSFRVPDGTDKVYWTNSLTGLNGDIIQNTNGMWKGSVAVNEGTNPITFTAKNSSNAVLASTNFTVIKLNNMRSTTVSSDNCDWTYYWEGEPAERYTSSEIVIGWASSSYSGNYGWEEAIVRFDMPSLPGRISGTDIEAQFKVYLYEAGSYGKGSCKITAAAISPDWAYRIETVNWNRLPLEYMPGTDFEVDVVANPASTTKRWVPFDASKAVKNWLDGATNKGFVLWASGDPFEGVISSTSNYNRCFTDYRLEISYQVETTPPTLNIISPVDNHTVNSTVANIMVSGTSSDNTSLKNITWKNNTTGTMGTASGTTAWNFNVNLNVGSNQIIVTATDVVDNCTSKLIFINRADPDTTPPDNVTNGSTLQLTEAIKLSWQNPTNTDFMGVIILQSHGPILTELARGVNYAVGDNIGESRVIFKGLVTSFIDSGLKTLEEKYYKIISYDQYLNYASGVTLFGIPLMLQEEYELTILSINGQVIKSPSKTSYSKGEEVTLIAMPHSGYSFASWSGSASGTSNRIIINMDGDKLISANFVKSITEENNIIEGLVYHTMLDDCAGTIVSDSDYIELTAVIVNGPIWGCGWRDDDFLRLNGPLQAIVIPTFCMSKETGTIAIWAEPSNLSGIKIIVGHVYNNMNRLCLYTVEGKLAVGLGSNAALEENIINLVNEERVHLALTWNNTDYAVYVNGQIKAGGKFVGLTELNSTIDIGNYGDPASRTFGFNGNIDDVRMYNRALNSEEIKDLFFTHDIRQGKELRFTIQAIDSEGHPILYEASSLPKGASFDKTTQTATWIPWHNQQGVFKFEFTAPDQPNRVVHVVVHPTEMTSWYEKAREVMSTYEIR